LCGFAKNAILYQQPPEPQSQVGSVPRSNPLMMPAAHPTPDLTVTAPVEQFIAQAPHSIINAIHVIGNVAE